VRGFVIIILIGVATALTIFGCNKYSTQDCEPSNDCYPYEIDSGYVTVNVTYNANGAGVPVALYEGYVEDNNLIWYDTVYEESFSFWLPTKKRYAAEAYYYVGGPTTVALDGKKLKEKSYDDCGVTCYEINEIFLDLKKL
jgi:hypothetical protein